MSDKSFAEALSFIFNPPIVAAAAFLFLIIALRPANALTLAWITVIFGAVIPLGIVYELSRRGTIPDIWASQRETRIIPFSGALVSYAFGSLALIFARSPAIITSLMFCYFGNTFIMMLISLWWKISVHASGIAGPCTALVYSIGAIATPLLLLIVPVGWARIRLKAHTLPQVVAGALLTVLITWVQMGFYLAVL
jgi:hypothetical protein